LILFLLRRLVELQRFQIAGTVHTSTNYETTRFERYRELQNWYHQIGAKLAAGGAGNDISLFLRCNYYQI
jgi:hypothetical protein